MLKNIKNKVSSLISELGVRRKTRNIEKCGIVRIYGNDNYEIPFKDFNSYKNEEKLNKIVADNIKDYVLVAIHGVDLNDSVDVWKLMSPADIINAVKELGERFYA